MIGLTGFDVVDASHIGVKNRFGEVLGLMQPGMQWTGLFTSVEQYDLRVQKMTVEMLEGEQTSVDIDGQTVKARIQVNYKLNPENIEDTFVKVGRANDVVNVLNIEGIIREGFKTTTSKYKSKEIWQKRNEVKEEAIKRISANFPSEHVILVNIIISDLDFNPKFLQAIEDQKTNEELAIAKKKQVEIAEQEAIRVEAEAKGQAEAKKVNADAEAYQKKAMAEAEAYQKTEMAKAEAFQRLELAKAEAEGLKLKREQLDDRIVRNNWIDAWAQGGAQVPNWVMGEGAAKQFLMNVDANEGA